MRPSPFFAVVIPTFNQADFLKMALTSVLDQTFEEFEVFVVNNESTDATLDVISDLGDSRVQVIKFQNHGVIGAARNVGIRASTAPYVAFLDSDDSWYRNKLERVAEAFEDDPEIGLVCHDQDLIWDGQAAGRTHYGPTHRFRGSTYEQVLFIGNGPSTSATVVRREYLDQAGCFSEKPEYIAAEDFDLWLTMAKISPFKYLPEVMGSHHFHGTNASDNIDSQLSSIFNILDKHCAELKKSSSSNPRRAIRRLYAHTYFGAGRQEHRRGRFHRTLKYYAKALSTYPLHLKTYGGLALLLVDRVLGFTTRRRISSVLLGPSWRRR